MADLPRARARAVRPAPQRRDRAPDHPLGRGRHAPGAAAGHRLRRRAAPAGGRHGRDDVRRRGVGLAACQIGVDRAVFVFDCPTTTAGAPSVSSATPATLPEGKDRNLDEDDEGCLSFPGAFVECARPTSPRHRHRSRRLAGEVQRRPACWPAACSTRPTTPRARSSATGCPPSSARGSRRRWRGPPTTTRPTGPREGPRRTRSCTGPAEATSVRADGDLRRRRPPPDSRWPLTRYRSLGETQPGSRRSLRHTCGPGKTPTDGSAQSPWPQPGKWVRDAESTSHVLTRGPPPEREPAPRATRHG